MKYGKRGAVAIAVVTALSVPTLAFAESYSGNAPGVDADNTARNARGGSGLTAMDQSSDPGDVAVTREIRKRITDQDALSTNARNVKVITIDRVVTLRGPVEDETEKMAIAAIAKSVAGVKSVDNQLEIDAR